MDNPNDAQRWQLLRMFYERNSNARSRRGKTNGAAMKISTVKSQARSKFGLTQQAVSANLTYLLSRGWVEEETIERQVTTGSTIRSVPETWYCITADGIDKIEGDSDFQMPERFGSIHINADSSLVAVGNGNYVQAGARDLSEAIEGLKSEVSQATELTDPEKLSTVMDLETIVQQLGKPTPSVGVVREAWQNVKGILGAAGLSMNLARVEPLIERLLGRA